MYIAIYIEKLTQIVIFIVLYSPWTSIVVWGEQAMGTFSKCMQYSNFTINMTISVLHWHVHFLSLPYTKKYTKSACVNLTFTRIFTCRKMNPPRTLFALRAPSKLQIIKTTHTHSESWRKFFELSFFLFVCVLYCLLLCLFKCLVKKLSCNTTRETLLMLFTV